MRVPAFALILLLAVGLAIWANRHYEAQEMRPKVSGAVPEAQDSTAHDTPMAVPGQAEKPATDSMEITVNKEQTLSAIAMNKLGSFDDEVLRQIENLNPGLKDPNLIHPGEKILLPRHATPPGDGEISPDPNLRKRP